VPGKSSPFWRKVPTALKSPRPTFACGDLAICWVLLKAGYLRSNSAICSVMRN
jgi:hypothetical protein